jgi:hypothetical protein
MLDLKHTHGIGRGPLAQQHNGPVDTLRVLVGVGSTATTHQPYQYYTSRLTPACRSRNRALELEFALACEQSSRRCSPTSTCTGSTGNGRRAGRGAGPLRGRSGRVVPDQAGSRERPHGDPDRAGARAQAGQDPDRAAARGRRGVRFPRLSTSLGALPETRAHGTSPSSPLALTRGDATSPRPDPELTLPKRLRDPVEEVVRDINRYLRGWGGHFRYGHSARHFDRISNYALRRLALAEGRVAMRPA